MDIRAWIEDPITIQPGERKMIHTGIYIGLPVGFEAQIRPRSGLAYKHGISVVNSPGTIDCGYRGEVGVALINHSSEPFTIYNGDRIAQMVFAQVPTACFCEVNCVEELSEHNRGGGFGHTGIK